MCSYREFNKFMGRAWVYLSIFTVGIISLGTHIPDNEDHLDTVAPAPIGRFLDGQLPAATPGGEGPWKVIPTFSNLTFEDPTVLTAAPGSDCIFVGTKKGIIHNFDNYKEVEEKHTFLNIADRVAEVYDGGLLGLAFHPDYGKKGAPHEHHFYVFYCAREKGADFPKERKEGFFNTWLRLSRFSANEDGIAEPSSELIMINIRLKSYTHRGGGLTFGNDGYLYLSIGDQNERYSSQKLAKNLQGGVLRLDVDCEREENYPPKVRFPLKNSPKDEISGVGYCIPADNPFTTTYKKHFEEYYSIGHRAPHRLTNDPYTGMLWMGDVGSSQKEEVNIIQSGGNYGWPFREGTQIKGLRPVVGIYGEVVDPVTDFSHPDMQAIIGGYVYRGSALQELQGKYICGDYVSNNIYQISYDPGDKKGEASYLCQFTPGKLSTFGQDMDGEMYLCGLGKNVRIHRLVRAGSSVKAPSRLSQINLFHDFETLQPIPGVVPYEVNSPLYDDGAIQKRWIAMPNDGNLDSPNKKVKYNSNKYWEFPKGTVFIKHLEMPLDESDSTKVQRLETQLLVHGEDGIYYGLAYKWTPDGKDALLASSGMDTTLAINTPQGIKQQVWHTSNRGDCLACHNKQSGRVLGFNGRQLNKELFDPRTKVYTNQLKWFNQLGYFYPKISTEAIDQMVTSASLDDPDATVSMKARSYLDANCSYCHQPGTTNRGGFDARLTTPFRFQGFLHRNVIHEYIVSQPGIIIPENPSRSVLYLNMKSVHESKSMPPLAKNKVHQKAVRLISTWIKQIDPSSPSCLAENLALNKPTKQSSTYKNNHADFAVDGNTTGLVREKTVAHTENELNPFWEIDLESVSDIYQIKVWNRTDCCKERLTNFHLLLSEEPFVSDELEEVLNQDGVTKKFWGTPTDNPMIFNIDQKSRYIRIQLAKKEFLSLAEIEIMGCSMEKYQKEDQRLDPDNFLTNSHEIGNK